MRERAVRLLVPRRNRPAAGPDEPAAAAAAIRAGLLLQLGALAGAEPVAHGVAEPQAVAVAERVSVAAPHADSYGAPHEDSHVAAHESAELCAFARAELRAVARTFARAELVADHVPNVAAQV